MSLCPTKSYPRSRYDFTYQNHSAPNQPNIARILQISDKGSICNLELCNNNVLLILSIQYCSIKVLNSRTSLYLDSRSYIF
ncbi:hypothetical protein PBPRA1315 [Photobacterium profundum SS9]|uniref:Uncharacterized protein n=1 Tax=Photobacterium profundum (strain SS9) TaxID=298386 RepID=Q6LSK0_PHOPR|nr:hypothetical protein PBPRA1315 [Photobacterium profundum SS9]